MSKKLTKKTLATAVGGAFIASMAASPIASAAENPFSMNELSSGYMQVAAEGQCGGKKEGKEGQCGGKKEAKEGDCGGKKNVKEGNCGEKPKGPMTKGMEGQCGEGKCGGKK